METSEKANLLDALKNGVVKVSFRKIDTKELRIMPCTLKETILKENGITTTMEYSPGGMEAFPVWSLDKDAWRSFRLDTVEAWEVI